MSLSHFAYNSTLPARGCPPAKPTTSWPCWSVLCLGSFPAKSLWKEFWTAAAQLPLFLLGGTLPLVPKQVGTPGKSHSRKPRTCQAQEKRASKIHRPRYTDSLLRYILTPLLQPFSSSCTRRRPYRRQSCHP